MKRYLEHLTRGVSAIIILLAGCAGRATIMPMEAADEFERAMNYFEQEKYQKAVESFERILFYHPTSEYVDDAQYWLGRAYYSKKDYDQAINEFDYLIKNFSTSSLIELAYLYRAKAYHEKAPSYDRDPTEINNAIELFDMFLTRFPNSEHTNEVKDLILAARDQLARKEMENGKLYIKLGETEAALKYFNFVISNYPETSASEESKFQAAQLYEKNMKYEEALSLYRELLENEEWKTKAAQKIKHLETLKADETQ